MVSKLSTTSLCIIISLGLAACGAQIILQPTSIPSATTTVEPTEVPTTTFTPEPTSTPTEVPTPTLEPTKSPDQLAEAVGLNTTERSYVIETREGKTYLVDTYNQVPKAVKEEDATWRKLDYYNHEDAETMYAGLTPPDPEGIARNSYRNKGNTPPDVLSLFPRLSFNPIYTGDWVQRETTGPDGEQLTLTYLVTTWRDDTGGLRLMEVGVIAEAPGETFDLTWMCIETEDNGEYGNVELFTTADAFLDYLSPGIRISQVEFPFVKEGKTPKVPDHQIVFEKPWLDWKPTNALPRLGAWLLPQSIDGQLTEEDARRMNKTGVFTDRVLVSQAFQFSLYSSYDLQGGCP